MAFNVNSKMNQAILRLAQGDAKEAELLRQAMDLANLSRSGAMSVDTLVVPRFSQSVLSGRGSTFRDAHAMTVAQAKMNVRALAFRGPGDQFREEHSAFCYLMYQGYQQRFVDRHPGETPEAFLDRARKSTINLTRLVIRVLSQLYRRPPKRETTGTTPEHVAKALGDIWSSQYNLDLLAIDRYTRLLGTIGVRPFHDPEAPGGIRLWAFLSHQLRVIPDPARPWKPRAVIERHEPFGTRSRIVIWTDKTFLLIKEDGKAHGMPHSLGRIPITFFRDDRCFTSFFVEGRGRGLCDQNAVINGKLTDINEVEQFQGFSVPVAVNPEEDNLTIGPRRVLVFKPDTKDEPFGLEFKAPDAPLGELRAGIEADIRNLLRQEQIPDAALGAEIGRRALSGVAIRQAMAPIIEDNKERGIAFHPVEEDLADNVLRVKAKHEDFNYDPATDRATFAVHYTPMEFAVDIRDQIAQDEFDIAQGMKTPAELMHQRDPVRYKTHDDAVTQWKANLVELKGERFPSHGVTDDDQARGIVPPPREQDPAELMAELVAEVEGDLGAGRRSVLAGANGNGNGNGSLLDVLGGRV